MSNGKVAAGRLRWVLLVLAMACWLVGLFWIFNVAWPQWKILGLDMGLMGVAGFMTDSEGAYVAIACTVFGLFLMTQWFFLGPRGGWRVRLNQNGRPMKVSVIIAALLAGLLTAGLFATVIQLVGFWPKMVGEPSDKGENLRIWPMALAIAISWLLWAVIFLLYWRAGNRRTQMSRMLRGLFGGSVLELLVSTPVHVMALRSSSDERDCYCETGSYTGLVLGGTVLLWTFGPGLVLLFLREKERREPLLTKME